MTPCLCSAVARTSLLFLVVEASKDHNPHDLSHLPTESRFYSQHLSVNPEGSSVQVSAETESHTYFSDSDDVSSSEEAALTIVSSSVLYEGGCLLSSEAMMIHGGGGANSDSMFDGEFPAEVEINFDDDEEEEDDDDDDDGHSSMLSNASLYRARVAAGGASGSIEVANNRNSMAASQHCCSASSTGSAVLSLRGGADTTATLGSEFAKKLLVAAIVTLAYEAAMGHLLEFVKIVMQTSSPGTSYGQVLKMITAEKGILGVWDGFVPWGVVQAIFKGGVFGLAHAVATKLLSPLVEEGKIPKQLALTLAGGIGGGFQGYVLSPTLLLKTRVMTNPVFRESMSLLRTTLLSLRVGFDVVATEGLGALMKGANVFATKRVFDWATRYFFSDIFESIISSRKGGAPLTPAEKITASLLGGTASTLSTLPLDVLVAKMQDSKKAGVKVSAFQLFREELKELGWGGLYNSYMCGFEARLAHVCFTTVVMKTGSPYVYDALFGKKA